MGNVEGCVRDLTLAGETLNVPRIVEREWAEAETFCREGWLGLVHSFWNGSPLRTTSNRTSREPTAAKLSAFGCKRRDVTQWREGKAVSSQSVVSSQSAVS